MTPGGGDPARSPGADPSQPCLPPELKPFEAALASLAPAADRLEYDLIMFRAGQRSVAGKGRSGRVVSWARSRAMPAALAAMTAVAATFLVVLLTRPVVERVQIVRLPAVEPTNGGAEEGDVLPDRNQHEGQRQPAVRRAAIGQDGQPSRSGSDPSRSRAVAMELVARMLQQGVDPWARHVDVPAESLQAAEAPVPYIKQLRNVLGEQARASNDWPNVFFHSGAES